ncbi:MAG: thiamine phosphate synthase [Campylobacterota bacterium]|nr:thiamine phosphate synthase [Campylobacterota bacterium]
MKKFNRYLITDPKYYGEDVEQFSISLKKSLQSHHVDMVCFRDKTSSNTHKLAHSCVSICKETKIQHILINGNIALAKELDATGVHLTSMQFDEIARAKQEGLFTIISCHTHDEIDQAQKMGANAVTFSPIYSSPNKGIPKGIEQLKDLVGKYSIPIIALGGITTKQQVDKIQYTQCAGFASIRYFTH